MGLKAKPDYIPNEDDVFMFLNDATKQGYTNAEGLPIFLKMEYPTLKNSDIKRYMLSWFKEKEKCSQEKRKKTQKRS